MENVTTAIVLSHRVKKDGTSAIMMRITINRKVHYIPLNQFVSKKHFDNKSKRVKIIKEVPQARELNNFLQEKELLMNRVIIDLQNRRKRLSIQNIKDGFEGGGKHLFYDFCIKELQNELEAGEIKPYTVEITKGRLDKLNRFRKNVSVYDIDAKFVGQYKYYLANKLGNSQNTIAGNLCVLRKYLIRAKKQGLINYNPFESDVKVVWERRKKDYLELEELRKLLEYWKSKKFLEMKVYNKQQHWNIGRKYQEVIQHFLISCFSGLRLSDIKTLTKEHIDLKNAEIVKRMCKGKINKQRTVSIPLTHQLLEVLEINRTDNKVYSSKVKCDKDINKYLREALKIVGICDGKYITYHSSRHTFCVTALTLGMPIETVQEVMGHEDIKTTLIYAKIVDEKRKNDMQNAWGKFDIEYSEQDSLQVA